MRVARRRLVLGLGAAAGGLAIARPAVADANPEVRWRLASAFQPSFDLLFGAGRTFAQALSDMTDGQFSVAVSAAGELAPALETLDAVAEGKAECAHTALSYSWNKEPAYIFGTGAPFGMNARQQTAWLQDGGGGELIDKLLAERNLMALPLGDTAARWRAGFARRFAVRLISRV